MLPYVHFYLVFAHKNKLNLLENPLAHLGQNYNGGSVADGLEFLIDELFDKIIATDDLKEKHFDYELPFSQMAKNIYNEIPTKADTVVDDVIDSLSKTSNPEIFSRLIAKIGTLTRPNGNYIEKLGNNARIVELNRDLASKGILQLEQQLKEITHFKNQISNILYRNKTAHSAWIRKLGHYLIKNVAIISGDESIDLHVSDWFEVFNEISQHVGLTDGYNKMIGNRKDLTEFSTITKKSYKIILPLIFYWNKYTSHGIPLVASTNTQYQIKIELRNLDDVAYRDQFSEFMDPTNGKITIPKIKNAQLMMEYIYLSNEERRIFFGKNLEYLIDELQYEPDILLTDRDLIPFYKIKNSTKKRENIYLDKNDLSKHNDVELVPRKDYTVKSYKNRNGITQWITVNNQLSIDPYVHFKRFIHKYHFNNPTKMITVLVRPIIHIDPSLRLDEKNYHFLLD